MWLYLALASAVFLGLYDVAKKHSLRRNGVFEILLTTTVLATLLMALIVLLRNPADFSGSLRDHGFMVLKAVLVTASWVTGMMALKLLSITLVSAFKSCRPILVVLFAILFFGERLDVWKWAAFILMTGAIILLSYPGKGEKSEQKVRRLGYIYMVASVLTGVASALFDKYILQGENLAPLFVQFWANFYISVLLAVCLMVDRKWSTQPRIPFRWDWVLLLIAVLITAADYLYFYSVSLEGTPISMVSLVRRSSVIVTFVVGAMFFKEKRLLRKSVALFVMLVAMVLLFVGSK